MDEIDRKILVELDKNVRASNVQIAKAAHVSKDVVNYRIARLRKEGILTGFYALPAFSRIGKKFFKLLLKFQSLGSEKEKELTEWLRKHPNTIWVGICDGEWNMVVTLSMDKLETLLSMVDHIHTNYGKFLTKKELLVVSAIYIYNEKYLYPGGALAFEHKINITEESEVIDSKDSIIIQEMFENSRIETSELAKKISLTHEATAKRLKNLIKNGLIICYKPRISFTKLGYEYFHVFVAAKTREIVKEIMAYYKQHPDCICIVEEFGHYDMHIEFVTKGTQRFREILQDFRNRFGDKIHEYEPLPIYSEHRLGIFLPTSL